MLKAKIKDCAAKEGATDADVQEIFEKKPPSSHAGRCTMACVGEAGGMVYKQNETDKSNLSPKIKRIHFLFKDQRQQIGS